MARDNHDYDDFSTMSGGKLFNTTVRGFNKDEVISYLEEMTRAHEQESSEDKAHIRRLSKQLDDAEAAIAHLQTSQGTPTSASETDLLNQLQEHQNYTQQLLHDYEVQQQHIMQLTQDIEYLHANPATVVDSAEVSAVNEQVAHLQNENTLLQNDNTLLQNDMAALQTNSTTLQDDYLLIQNDYTLMQSDIAILQQDNATWQEEFNNAEQHILLMQEQLDSALSSTQHSEVYGQLSAEQQKSTELYNQLTVTQQDLANVTSQLEDLHQSYLTLHESSDPLQNEVKGLQSQLEEAWNNVNYYKNISADEAHAKAEIAASSILSDANTEATRIRDSAVLEKERLQRQITTSATGLSESVFNLRNEVADIENSVSKTMENMQHTMVHILSALAQTEQDLSTFTVQVDRFPISSPAVGKSPLQNVPKGEASFQKSESRKRNNVRAFRPTYSNSAGGQYWSNTSEALQPEEGEPQDVRMKDLSESLVDTLRQMMT